MANIRVLPEKCNACGYCIPACPYGALGIENNLAVVYGNCVDCELCTSACPTAAIVMSGAEERVVVTEDEARHIAVYLEFDGRELTPATKKVLAKARELANMLGCYVFGLAVGVSIDVATVAAAGADKVMTIGGKDYENYDTIRYTAALENLIKEANPEMLFFAHSFASHDLAPRIAHRMGTGYAGGCAEIDIDVTQRLLLSRVTSYGGRLVTEYTTPTTRPQVASLIF